MKRFLIFFLLVFVIAGCVTPGFLDQPDEFPSATTVAPNPTVVTPGPKGITPQAPGETPMVEEPPRNVVQVRWNINAPVYQNGLEAGSPASINLTFSPSIVRVTRRSDGTIYQTSSVDWKNHPVTQMRFCVAPEKPCSSLGELRPYQEKITSEIKLDWLGTRLFYLSAEFLERDGRPVPASDGWDVNTLSATTLVMDKQVTTVLNPATPLEKLPSPILTAAAATRTAFPVVGSVKIVGSPCCKGGTAGAKISITVNFQASSSAGKVTEMRVGSFCPRDPADLKADWQPFVPTRDFETTLALNWTTFYIAVQYRDEKGNLSQISCDNLGLEGSPVRPTSKP